MKAMLAVLCMAGGVWLCTGCGELPSAAAKAGGGADEKAASRVADLIDATFAAQTAQGVVLVDFWAPWCGPCRIQGPLVEQAAAQLGEAAKVFKVNVDQAQQTAQKFSVSSIPTLVVFKDGQPGKRFVGVTQVDELVAAVKAAQAAK